MVAPRSRPSDGSQPTEAGAERGDIGAATALWTAPAPVVITRQSGIIVAVNRAFVQRVSLASDDLVGRPLAGLVHPEDRGLLTRRAHLVARGETKGDLVIRLRAGARDIPCLIGAAASGDDHGSTLLTWVLVRPSTWSPAHGATSVSDMAIALSRLALTRSPGVQPLRRAGQATAWCREVTGEGSEVGLVLWRREGRELMASTSDTVRRWTRAQLDAGQGPVVTAFRDREMVRAADLGGDPRFPALATAVPSGHSAVTSPVTVDDAVVGALTVYDGRAGLLETDDVVLPSLAAAASAIAADLMDDGFRLDSTG